MILNGRLCGLSSIKLRLAAFLLRPTAPLLHLLRSCACSGARCSTSLIDCGKVFHVQRRNGHRSRRTTRGSLLCRAPGETTSAQWTRVIDLEPVLQTPRMEDVVATRQPDLIGVTERGKANRTLGMLLEPLATCNEGHHLQVLQGALWRCILCPQHPVLQHVAHDRVQADHVDANEEATND